VKGVEAAKMMHAAICQQWQVVHQQWSWHKGEVAHCKWRWEVILNDVVQGS